MNAVQIFMHFDNILMFLDEGVLQKDKLLAVQNKGWIQSVQSHYLNLFNVIADVCQISLYRI